MRKYSKLTDYAVADDPALKTAEAAEIASFLATSKRGGCGGAHCQDALTPPGFYREGEWVSECACMAAATECDATCVLTLPRRLFARPRPVLTLPRRM